MSDNLNISNAMSLDTMEGSNSDNNSSNSWMPMQESITQKVCAFANESLRRAASAIFRATARINNEISITELLDALEDVGINHSNSNNSSNDNKTEINNNKTGINTSETTRVVPIPSGSESGIESMSTTCSSVDSVIFPESDSANSLELPLDDHDHEDVIEFGPKALPIISMYEVGDHYTTNDAWMVLYDKVYDFSDFLYQHPGGWDVMQEYIGYDGTVAFRGVGHSKMALKMMDPYLIGVLPECERIYNNRGRW